MIRSPTRPALRYLGGKWKLAPWIVDQFPAHRVYVEPFGGAANVLLRKPRCQTEVYNDLDDDLVGLFRVLRDREAAATLASQLRLTPFARTEFLAAYERTDDPIEAARRLVVRSFMGFGSCASRANRTTGFRTGARRGDAPASREWATYPDALELIVERMAGVAIEQRPADKLIAAKDGPDVLFYVDPPYLHSVRSPKRTRTAPSNGYNHELSDADHVALLEQLTALEGMVVLSGYAHALYDRALAGWRRIEKATLADRALPRTEVLWLNPAAQQLGGLFCEVAA